MPKRMPEAELNTVDSNPTKNPSSPDLNNVTFVLKLVL